MGVFLVYDRKTLQKLEEEIMSELMNLNDSDLPVPFDKLDEGDRLYTIYRLGWKAALRLILRKTTGLMIDKSD